MISEKQSFEQLEIVLNIKLFAITKHFSANRRTQTIMERHMRPTHTHTHTQMTPFWPTSTTTAITTTITTECGKRKGRLQAKSSEFDLKMGKKLRQLKWQIVSKRQCSNDSPFSDIVMDRKSPPSANFPTLPFSHCEMEP